MAMKTVCLFVCFSDGMENKQAETTGWVGIGKRLVYWNFCFTSARVRLPPLGHAVLSLP